MKSLSFTVIPTIVMTLLLLVQMSLQAPVPTTGGLKVNDSHSRQASTKSAIGKPSTVVHNHGKGGSVPGLIAHTSELPACDRCNTNPCKCL
ncbi:uncharacterized protein FA14DRAFT_181070 [Meira miltonrushii]|uniref:Uncharacterized protein n=1 Tax=Meira miltonrushii TaxID=1280837 RepID=A0A316VAH8_9BASI|nr:uncharacterized protein FA14DRAFT_181070 [Meira miltonrushii]PWN34450.1 hypothetical protein FA14DRAFT_181070 [Meira miltonrushii]